MEEKEEKEKNKKKREEKSINKTYLLLCLIIVVLLVIILFVFNKKPNITVSVQSSLEKLVEKADLETANLNYNFVAKKCNDNNKNCDLSSNNIDDFDMVVSCKSIITIGIDFNKVKVVDDKSNKTVKISIPEAIIKEINPGSVRFLNGDELEADALVDARKLCEDTAKEKSSKDEKFMQAAKDQAIVVIKSFYEKWIKAINDKYKVEIN